MYKGISASPAANGVRLTVAIKCMDMHAANASKLSSDCVVSEIKILKSLKHRYSLPFFENSASHAFETNILFQGNKCFRPF